VGIYIGLYYNNIIKLIVKYSSDNRQIEFGIDWTYIVGAIYTISQTNVYLTIVLVSNVLDGMVNVFENADNKERTAANAIIVMNVVFDISVLRSKCCYVFFLLLLGPFLTCIVAAIVVLLLIQMKF
jgi:hypothetical protein